MIRETDPRNIPIHIAFGNHNKEGVSSLVPLKDKAKSYLSTEKGNVVWFCEAADATFETVHLPIAMARDMQHKLGIASHVDAYVQLQFIADRKRLPSAKELAKKRRQFLEDDDFATANYRAIESLSSDFPKRVIMAFEGGATPEDITEWKALQDRRVQLAVASNRLVHHGRFLEALPFFREGVDIFVRGVNTRDLRLGNSLAHPLFVPLDDGGNTIAEVGHLGAVHTKVYHMLKKAGYNVSCFFPEKEGSVYLYSPLHAAIRARVFFPYKGYTQEDWLKIFVQDEIYTALEIKRGRSSIIGALTDRSSSVRLRLFDVFDYLFFKLTNRRIPKTEQQLIKVVYEATRDFDEEKINKFGESVKERGLIYSAAQLISPYI